jgi:dolichyl-phosphate-mannose--protein O-mannosyl transferase
MSGTTTTPAAVHAAMDRYPGRVRRRLAFLATPVAAVLIVTALAAGLRFWHLTQPPDLVFDENYYPKAGCILIGGSNETCRIDSGAERYWRAEQWDVGSWVHPDLGKWQIGLGIKAFGMTPFGWRVTSALAGTLVVLLTAVLAQLLFGSVVWTYVAGGLLATEHLNVVLSRVALLDVHLELWVVAGFLAMVLDRRWLERRERRRAEAALVRDDGDADPDRPATQAVWSPIWRPWRFAAGVAFGAAASVKWSGAMALFGAVLLSYAWETVRRHHGDVGWAGAFGRAVARESLGIVLGFLIVPAAVFMLTWLPWLHHFGWDWGKWWSTQVRSYDFHAHGMQEFAEDPRTHLMTPTNGYYSRPWQWLLLWRPTSLWTQDLGPDIREIIAIGSPAIFWASLVAVPYTALAWWRQRDWRAGFVVVAALCQYVPWFFVHRPTFFFYVLPMTPFLVLAVTYLLRHLSDATLIVREPGGAVATNPETGGPAISTAYVYRPFVWIYLIATAILFVWFWPILAGSQISDLRWHAIVWFVTWV